MKVLKPNSELFQSLSIIPRKYSTSVIIDFRDEESLEVITFRPIDSKEGDYLFLSGQIEGLREGRFYEVTFYDKFSLEVIHKDKVFCTNQNIDQLDNDYYDINKDQYIFYNGSDKKYIVI